MSTTAEQGRNRVRQAAGAFRRSAAYLLDIVIFAPFLGILFLLSRVSPAFRGLFAYSAHAEAWQFGLLTLPLACWLILNEATRSATPGKALVGLQVAYKPTGSRLPAAVLRNVLKLLPWELNHAALWRIRSATGSLDWGTDCLIALTWVLVLIYGAGALFGRERRTLYDRASGTSVILHYGEEAQHHRE